MILIFKNKLTYHYREVNENMEIQKDLNICWRFFYATILFRSDPLRNANGASILIPYRHVQNSNNAAWF
jgi:hypothetical protein